MNRLMEYCLHECTFENVKQLKYKQVTLYTAADVVQYSFIVQPSLTPLNLELWSSNPTKENKNYFTYSRDEIFTEEKCRKILGKNRNLLYYLHLDLPKSIEGSLKRDSPLYTYITNGPALYISRIRIKRLLSFRILEKLVEYACNSTDHGYAALTWFLKIDAFFPHETPSFSERPSFIEFFVNFITNSDIVDPEFVLGCFNILFFEYWLQSNPQPSAVEKLLLQVKNIERKYDLNPRIKDFVYSCFIRYEYTTSVLKIQNAPWFQNIFLQEVSGIMSPDLYRRGPMPIVHRLRRHLRPERRTGLMIHLFWVYLTLERDPTAASEAVRLVWDSISDVFLNKEEFVTTFADIALQKVEDVYQFYSESVGKSDSESLPRSLKHLARVSIRRRLVERKHWLPTAIRETGLPSNLQSYLSLERKAGQLPCTVNASVKRSECRIGIYFSEGGFYFDY